MANYNNNYSGNNGNYNNGGNYQSGQRQQRQQRRENRKHSGAKMGVDKNGKPYVRGWYLVNRILISVFAAPNKKTHDTTSGRGITWQNWTLTTQNKMTGKQLHNALFNTQNSKVTCGELGIVLNPNAPNGGYCGSFSKKRN